MTAALSDAWELSSTKPLSVQDFASAFPRDRIDFVFDRKVPSSWKYKGSRESQDLFNDCLEFISLIDAEGPKALDDVLELMPDEHAVIIAFLCYLRGDVDDLCTRLLAHVDNRDGFFIFCEWIQREIGDQHNGALIPIHEPLKKYSVNTSFSSLASAFVNYKMTQAPEDSAGFEAYMDSALRMAVRYGLTEEALLRFNLGCPIPTGLIKTHEIGMANLRNLLANDVERSRKIIDDLYCFKDMDWNNQIVFIWYIIGILSAAYKIHPGPEILYRYSGPEDRNAYACMPEGSIFNQSFNPSGGLSFNADYKYKSILEILVPAFHEYAHTLELFTMLANNPRFRELRGDSIDPEILRNLAEAGLCISFNTASSVTRRVTEGMDHSPLYLYGKYYQLGETDEEQHNYGHQICEAHAYTFQDVIMNHFFEGLEMAYPGSIQSYIFNSSHNYLKQIIEELSSIEADTLIKISEQERLQIQKAKERFLMVASDDIDMKKKLEILSECTELLLSSMKKISLPAEESTKLSVRNVLKTLYDAQDYLKIIPNFNNKGQPFQDYCKSIEQMTYSP